MGAAVSVVVELLLDVLIVLVGFLIYQFYQLRKVTEKSIEDLSNMYLDECTNNELLKSQVAELEARLNLLESLQQQEKEENEKEND